MYSSGAHTPHGILQYRWYPKIKNVLQVVVEFGLMNQTAWFNNVDFWIHVTGRPL
jgi:hypothetical protein